MSSRPPKRRSVAIIRNAFSYDFGGGERLPVDMALSLKRRGWEVLVISKNASLLNYADKNKVDSKKGFWSDQQDWSGRKVLLLPLYLLWLLFLTTWYAVIFVSRGTGVVHIQSRDDFIAATIAGRLSGARVIWTDHADLKYIFANRVWYKNPIGKLVYFCSRWATSVVIVSENERLLIEESLGHVLPANFRVIYNGVNPQTPKTIVPKNGKFVFCSTSRLVKTKGIAELITAFKNIQSKNKNTALWLVGTGPEVETFKEMAKGIKNVDFIGYSDAPLDYVAACDVFVHPSYNEAFSLSLVEAAMLGKPIVACKTGGNAELVEDGKSGLLVPVKDAQALEQAMLTLYKNKALRYSMGEAAKSKYAVAFRFEDIIDSYVRLYEKSPMKILFDATPVANSAKSGVGYYTSHIITTLARQYPDEILFIGQYYNFLGRKKVKDLPRASNITYRPTLMYPGKVVNLFRKIGVDIPFELIAKARADLLFFPNFFTLPSLFRKPIAVTVHDLSYQEYPQYVSSRNLAALIRYVPKSVKRARLILTDSEFSKKEIMHAFGVAAENIFVNPIPPMQTATLDDGIAKKEIKKVGVSKDFILFVGNIEPRKNLLGLIEAYRLCDQKIRDSYSLVIAGGSGWNNAAINARIDELRAEGHDIIKTGYVSERCKTALYTKASVLVMPSFYEGFGMPILEAFQTNTPVAVSDIDVFRETAGEAAVFFDPNDEHSIAKAITDILTTRSLADRLRKLGRQQLLSYSWEQIAGSIYARFVALLTD